MTSCRSCASCERELSAVRLELQAVVRERDQYRDALEQMATCEAVSPGGWCLCEPGLAWAHDIARVALSRERKDTT